eukprot:664681-Amphidinium_carterae.1
MFVFHLAACFCLIASGTRGVGVGFVVSLDLLGQNFAAEGLTDAIACMFERPWILLEFIAR